MYIDITLYKIPLKAKRLVTSVQKTFFKEIYKYELIASLTDKPK